MYTHKNTHTHTHTHLYTYTYTYIFSSRLRPQNVYGRPWSLNTILKFLAPLCLCMHIKYTETHTNNNQPRNSQETKL